MRELRANGEDIVGENRLFQIGGNHAHSAVSGNGDGCRETPLV